MFGLGRIHEPSAIVAILVISGKALNVVPLVAPVAVKKWVGEFGIETRSAVLPGRGDGKSFCVHVLHPLFWGPWPFIRAASVFDDIDVSVEFAVEDSVAVELEVVLVREC